MLLSRLNDVVWSPWLLGLFLAAGLYYSLRTGFFQLFRIPLWLRTTFGAMLRRRGRGNGRGISQFQALATAIVEESKKRNLPVTTVGNFTALHGRGVRATLGNRTCMGGNLAMMEEAGVDLGGFPAKAEELAAQGKTALYFADEHQVLGLIAVADTPKPTSAGAVAAFRKLGLDVVMLTGDNQRTAEAIGRQAGVDQVIAGVLPDGKESVIRSLQSQGKVAMVGDGINDAPALTRADIGIAIGAGTDVAIDAADVVLMNSRLTDVPAAIRLSRATLRNIHENLFWAFIYNIIGIPLAAGVFIPLLGWQLNPMFGAAAMSLSSFCVVSNALRLNLFDPHSARKDHKIKFAKEPKTMQKTLKIEGMMCTHCSGRVKKALEELPGVVSAEVSHENGTAVVTMSAPVDDATLKKAVEDQGYQVVG